ncbi:MAG: hypothetical protein J7621_23320 [Niastella sp.]|nr:hypothetical protein [Niastella sp.]
MDQQNDEDYAYNITIPLKKVFEVLAHASKVILKHSGAKVSRISKQDLQDDGIYIKTLLIGEYPYRVRGGIMRGPQVLLKGRLLERLGFKRKNFVQAIIAQDFILIIPAESFPPDGKVDLEELKKILKNCNQ